jgi:hypothetical protein
MISIFLSVLAVGMLVGVSTSCRWGGGVPPQNEEANLVSCPKLKRLIWWAVALERSIILLEI